MIHARNDYNRIQDPAISDPSLLSPGSSPIGKDEPVFLIRGKDQCAFAALAAWAAELERLAGHNEPALATAYHVRRWAFAMRDWARDNEGKIPDTPVGELTDVPGFL